MFFRNLLKRIGARKRFRNSGRMGANMNMMNPNMQFGLMGLNPMMRRRMKAKMMGLPDPSNFDANNLPVPALGNNLPMATPGRRSDIMPRDGMMPKQPPQLGLAPQMPGVPPRGSGLPSLPKPMMGINMGMPNYMSSGQPPKMVIGMNEGGEAKYPNAGLAALAKERPDVVKKILGREDGGIMDIQNFPRRSPEMLIDQLNNIIDTDSKYAESVILPNTIFRNNDYENRRKNDPFFTDIYGRPQAESDRPDGVPFFVTNPFSATVLKIIEAIKGVDLRNDPIGIDKVNFLRRRLIDNIKQIEDQGGTVDPDVKAQAMFVEIRFKERNMPLTD